jgi:hypothetical protein
MAAVAAARPFSSENELQRRTQRSNDPELRARQREISGLVASFMTTAGYDAAEIAGARRRHEAVLERIAAAQKADAVQQTPNLHRGLYAGLDMAVSGVKDRADGQSPTVPADAIHEPFLIWADVHSSEILVDSGIVPDRSWAKVRMSAATDEGTWAAMVADRRLSFWFMWQSQSPNSENVDVLAYVVLSGHLEAMAKSWEVVQTNDGDQFTYPGEASAGVGLGLYAWTWWTQPAVPVRLMSRTEGEVGMRVFVEGRREADFESKVVGANIGIYPWYPVTVPPYATLVLEVAVDLRCVVHRGRSDIDFASGPWRITCPFVQVRRST